MIEFSGFKYSGAKEYYRFKEPLSSDYRVYINGAEAPVYTGRISKHSFNTVWPGHQRMLDQTVEAGYVNLVSDEAFTVEVEPLFPCEDALLKPYSKGVVMEKTGGRFRFTLDRNGGYVFMGSDGKHVLYLFNSRPLLCDDPAQVTHYFGPGIHFPGKIVLHDDESVYIHKDALVYGCIFAENAKNIRVFGNGIFDDSTEERVGNYCYEEYTNGNIKLYNCENVRIEGVGFKNSAIWCVNIFNCRNVMLDDVKVFGQWRYNTDGIDIVNSSDIFIRNSFFHSFDDTISLKGIDAFKDSDLRNIRMDNCVLWCDWGEAFRVGVESLCREYADISFTNCDVLRAGHVAIAVDNGDCSEMHDLLFENISVEYNAFDTPSQYQNSDDEEYAHEGEFTIPRLVCINNWLWKTPETIEQWDLATGPLPDLTGIRPGYIRDVTIRGINVYYAPQLPLKDGEYDIRMIVQRSRGDEPFSNITIENISVNGKTLTTDFSQSFEL